CLAEDVLMSYLQSNSVGHWLACALSSKGSISFCTSGYTGVRDETKGRPAPGESPDQPGKANSRKVCPKRSPRPQPQCGPDTKGLRAFSRQPSLEIDDLQNHYAAWRAAVSFKSETQYASKSFKRRSTINAMQP